MNEKRLHTVEKEIGDIKEEIARLGAACDLHAPMAIEAKEALPHLGNMLATLVEQQKSHQQRNDFKDNLDDERWAAFNKAVSNLEEQIAELQTVQHLAEVYAAEERGKAKAKEEAEEVASGIVADRLSLKRKIIGGVLTLFALPIIYVGVYVIEAAYYTHKKMDTEVIVKKKVRNEDADT